jgi:nucleotide-binding universal stress UspA family protein
MFTNVLWATDGSEHADRALEYATRLAAEGGGTLHAVHVVEKLIGGRASGQHVFANEETIDAKIERQVAATAADAKIKATVHMTSSNAGDVARHIADMARDCGADVIVVGTRGHSALAGVALGSVTQRLLHLARCPVLAVPPAAALPAEQAGDALTTVG